MSPANALRLLLLLTLFCCITYQVDAAKNSREKSGRPGDNRVESKRQPLKTDQRKELSQMKPDKKKKGGKGVKLMEKPRKEQQLKIQKDGGKSQGTKGKGHGGRKAVGKSKGNVAHLKTPTRGATSLNGGPVTDVLCWIANLVYNLVRIQFFGNICGKGSNATTIASRSTASPSKPTVPVTVSNPGTTKKPDVSTTQIPSSTKIMTTSQSTNNPPTTTTNQVSTVPTTTAQPATMSPSSASPTTILPTSTSTSASTSVESTSTSASTSVAASTSASTSVESTSTSTSTSVAASTSASTSVESTSTSVESTSTLAASTDNPTFPTTTAVNPYCGISSCTNSSTGNILDQTLCNYSSTQIGPSCSNYNATLSVISASVILPAFNLGRSDVAQGHAGSNATNMRELYWDTELAQLAQTWAQQCMEDQEDICRDVSRFQVGQLVFTFKAGSPMTSALTSEDVGMLVEMGYLPVISALSSAQISSFQSGPSSLYRGTTQLFWAESYQVGCGVSHYTSTNVNDTEPYKSILVCNFGPAGNIVGQPIYQIGAPGSNCPTGTVVNATTGLCYRTSA